MFRVVKLLLFVTAVCGVLSLAVFYIYTARHYHKSMINVLKLGELKAQGLLSPTLSVHSRAVTDESPTQKKAPFTRPFSSGTESLLATQAPSISGGDSVDKLIETSLEKNKKRGHSDGDEETTELPTEKDTPTETSSQEDSTKNTEEEEENLELCPSKPPSLTGPLFVNQNVPKMEDLEKHFSEDFGGWVRKGGTWKPSHCKARVKMVLIIPFRKRYEQLAIFVRHMHPMLKRQEIDYRIMVVEQSGNTPFNRAILFNIGYKEALKFKNYNCFIFHDVDLLPEDDRNMYTCPTSPRHMSVAVDKFNYHLPYASIFGGAGAFLRKDFEEINGFSNKFWGWGGEDDDLYQRVVAKGHHLSRPSAQIGRYKMVRIHHHQSSKADPNSGARIKSARIRMHRDGLNSLKYKVLQRKQEPMYTIVTIDVNPKHFKTSMDH